MAWDDGPQNNEGGPRGFLSVARQLVGKAAQGEEVGKGAGRAIQRRSWAFKVWNSTRAETALHSYVSWPTTLMAPTSDSPRKAATTLNVLKDALKMVANVADGGINAPFVKPLAQIAIDLVDAAQVSIGVVSSERQ
ncbi:hypothetical protein NEOLEDRAFT_1129128 [Neolentinus lepideus HHB14362 ss-1]|uniref:Uncharacterized protein n=1 Tax=Neolentinus lepideus HHB14362 ss-1 TaxID=1314782 RepID=A0A165UXY8_9AGAM|nr:hypothetical protein NEOLEDRAFT_1129128 [Neolentinus lepideus HHB14362 ss-1]